MLRSVPLKGQKKWNLKICEKNDQINLSKNLVQNGETELKYMSVRLQNKNSEK